MSEHGSPTGASVIPTVRYRDVPRAIAWLCNALGFEEHRVVTDKTGAVRFAQLTFGSGMVMVAPVQESAFGRLMVQPSEIGGVETQICYLFVEDANAHHARAKAAGAEIVLDMEDEVDGGRGYSCRDPEGHLWNFGTYDPWQSAGPRSSGRPIPAKGRAVAALLSITLIAAVAFTYEPAQNAVGEAALTVLEGIGPAVDSAHARERRTNEKVERTLREARELAAKERAARDAAERASNGAHELLARERRAREAAELAAKEVRDELVLLRRYAETAERGAAEARERPAQDHGAALAAERAAQQAREELAQVRAAQQAAHLIAMTARERLEQARVAADAAQRSAKEAVERLAEMRIAKEAAERAAKAARYQARRERSARIQRERVAAEIAASSSPYFLTK
jgi:uncharacterized glyoxalase superfamily protein PhnB